LLGYKARESIPKLSEEYMAGRLKLDEFITHTMPLERINEAFDLMRSGKRFVLSVRFVGSFKGNRS